MKKSFLISGLCLISTLCLMSCSSDDNNDSPSSSIQIPANELPSNAKALVETYFSGISIQNAEKKSAPTIRQSVYKAFLSNGFEIDFNIDGNWTEIESKNKQPIPTEFLNKEVSLIRDYVTTNYPNAWIVEIDRENFGYSVELNTGIELIFNMGQEFVGIDLGDDNEEIIIYTSLPKEAQNFVKSYFFDSAYVLVKKEIDHGATYYKAYLSAGYKIEFDAAGNWIEIESKIKSAIPAAIIITPIQTYISTNYLEYKVISIEKEMYGYQVKIMNNFQELDLKFDLTGNFLAIDR